MNFENCEQLDVDKLIDHLMSLDGKNVECVTHIHRVAPRVKRVAATGVAMCCSVLQCMLRCAAVCCNVLQCGVAVWCCSVLQCCVAVCCSVTHFRRVAPCVKRIAATGCRCCSVCVAVCVLQCVLQSVCCSLCCSVCVAV